MNCTKLSDFEKQCPNVDCNTAKCPIFRKVVIPSNMGSDEEGQPYAPENGAYENALVYYEASGVSYIYSSDGIYTKIAQITGGQGEVISVNGKKGVVTITIDELDGLTADQIVSRINSAKAEDKAYTDAKIAQVEAEISTINSKIPAEASVSNQLADKTFVSGLVSDEASARELADTNLQGQIDAITSASDVVDVVGTYSELQAYDTQHLNDNDIVKVLVDETHDNAITYYRWTHSTIPYSWIYIGSQGPFYTKAESDTLLNEKADKSNTYTKTEVDTALAGKVDKVAGKGLSTNDFTTEEKTKLAGLENTVLESTTGQSTTAGMTQKAITDALAGIEDVQDYVIKGAGAPTTSTVGTVGKLYEDTTNGDLYQCTAVSGSTYTWEEVGGGENIIQVNNTNQNLAIPCRAEYENISMGGDSVFVGCTSAPSKPTIGFHNSIYGSVSSNGLSRNNISLYGWNSEASGNGATSIGVRASSSAYGVAVGMNSTATQQGEFSIGGSGLGANGYNGTSYRKITNVHDGENAHDAATLAQGNTLASSAPTTSTVGVVGQLYTDTSTGKLYHCTAVSDSTYTWEAVGGGGGGVNVVQTTGTSTTDVMSQNAVSGLLFGKSGNNYSNEKLCVGKTKNNLQRNGSAEFGINADTNNFGQISFLYGNMSDLGITKPGVFNIGVTNSAFGYDSNSNYRLLTGLHDPVSDHDAATKAYVDSHSGGGASWGDITGTLSNQTDLQSALDDKQDKLTAGTGISIVDNVISATGGGGGGDGIKVLTSADYNWNSTTQSVTEPYDSVAFWRLTPGIYTKNDSNVTVYYFKSGTTMSNGQAAILNGSGSFGREIFIPEYALSNIGGSDTYKYGHVIIVSKNSGASSVDFDVYNSINNLTTTSSGAPLDAHQGKVLNDKIVALEARIAALEGNA